MNSVCLTNGVCHRHASRSEQLFAISHSFGLEWSLFNSQTILIQEQHMSVILQFPTSQEIKKISAAKSDPREPKKSVEIIVFPIERWIKAA